MNSDLLLEWVDKMVAQFDHNRMAGQTDLRKSVAEAVVEIMELSCCRYFGKLVGLVSDCQADLHKTGKDSD